MAEQYNVPIIVSTHPRTRKRIENIKDMEKNDRIRFLKPFGFIDYNYIQMNALCAISDSGTISEESAMLNFPAVTIRNSMERPEAIDVGTIILTGFDLNTVLDSVQLVINEHENSGYPHIIPDRLLQN